MAVGAGYRTCPRDTGGTVRGELSDDGYQTPDAGPLASESEGSEEQNNSSDCEEPPQEAPPFVSDANIVVEDYFSSSSSFSRITFLEDVKFRAGDANFFSKPFHAWNSLFLNGLRKRIGEFAKGDARKFQAIDCLKSESSHGALRAGQAWYKTYRRAFRDKEHAQSYLNVTVDAALLDRERAMTVTTKRKRRAAPVLETPQTPGHETWEVVIAKAAREEFPQYRLSFPCAVRNRKRGDITAYANELVQSLVSKHEQRRESHRDFGALCEHLAETVLDYDVQPKRIDDRLRHLLELGRSMRNSPVHIRECGWESAPWDNDFLMVTRTAAFCALATAVGAVDDSLNRAAERIEAIRNLHREAIVTCAMTTRRRVCDTSEYMDAVAAKTSLGAEGDKLGELGRMRWTFVAQLLADLHRTAVTELKDVLNYYICVPTRLSDLNGLLWALIRAPAKKRVVHVKLYGGINLHSLRKSTQFALEEASRNPTGAVPPEWALLHLGAFLELLLTLRAPSAVIIPHFRAWEGILLAFARDVNLDHLENEKMEKDAQYRKRHRATLSSDSDLDFSVLVEDPFALPSGDTSGDTRRRGAGAGGSTGVARSDRVGSDQAGGAEHKRGNGKLVGIPGDPPIVKYAAKVKDTVTLEPEDEDDLETLSLLAELRQLERKRKLRRKIQELKDEEENELVCPYAK